LVLCALVIVYKERQGKMPNKKPRTKAGKRAVVKNDMDRFKAGTLKSSSGQKVTNPKQAIAISLHSAGIKKK
jgi:hypothetical protein